MNRASVSAVVLAAGASRRLGSPKALARLGKRPALALVLDRIGAAGVERGAVVVAEPHQAQIRAAVDPAPLEWAVNPDPAAGRLGSIQCGLRTTPDESDVLLWPVDRPLGSAKLTAALLEARGGAGESFVVSPVCDGRRGHPLVLAAALRDRLLGARPDVSLREILTAEDVRRIDVPAPDEPGIHANLDTEEAARRARGHLDGIG